MKKIITIILFALFSLGINSQEKETNFINMSEIIQCEGMTANQIYGNIMQNWSTLNGANIKSENSLDYCDKESGTINIKTKVYIGYHKTNGLYGYEGYANLIITFKIKDERYKITMTANTVTFVWTGTKDFETVNINELYPEYIAKTKLYYIKKASNDLVLGKMPNIMNNFFILCKKLHMNNEDDF